MKLPIFTLALLALNSNAFGGDAPKFHEVTRLHPGGEGGWDYALVDSDTRRLFIARGNRVQVVDVDTGNLLGEITGMERAHGVALVKDQKRGFATSGGTGEVVVFDLENLKTVGKIKAGENPDAIYYDPSSKNVFAFNGKSKDISVIDPVGMKTLGKVDVGGKPEFATGDGTGHIYFNVEDKNEMQVLDTKTNQIVAHYPLAPCEEPTGLSRDPQMGSLIVGCGNGKAVIVNPKNGKVLQTFVVGDGVDATAFDSRRKLDYISAGEGTLTVLEARRTGFTKVADVKTAPSARTLAVDEKTGQVFLPMAKMSEKKPGARPSPLPGSFEILVIGK